MDPCNKNLFLKKGVYYEKVLEKTDSQLSCDGYGVHDTVRRTA